MHKIKKLYVIISFIIVILVVFIFFYVYNNTDYVIVHFIDVGQGKSTLIQSPYGTILIDGGDVSAGNTVVSYLFNYNIRYIDYVIATHPHSDHIGGLIPVIRTFDIGNIIKTNRSHDTLIYGQFREVISSNDIDIIIPYVPKKFTLGNIEFEIIAPNNRGYSSLNDYSIVILMTYNDIRFLFAADAEEMSEIEMLMQGYEIDADILQVGHHGSITSTSYEFLQAVSPYIAVISAGRGNMYGHPNQPILDRLNDSSILIYRTDYHGHIVISTDGNNIFVK
ncbi:MAG: MBL fold metallo-hydrolase [Defluviitaleaceae bacterium]|nr:MBL fold metallo-hydrolase [Defluviitaleaceae bacterium]